MIGTNNIVIGLNAGIYLTTEAYQFIVSDGKKEIRTEMSHEEYVIIKRVIDRATKNIIILEER